MVVERDGGTRAVRRLGAGALGIALLAGCGGGRTVESGAPEGEASASAAASATPTPTESPEASETPRGPGPSATPKSDDAQDLDLVSSVGGSPIPGGVAAVSMSADGRWVAFTSPGNDPAPTKTTSILVRDLREGRTRTVATCHRGAKVDRRFDACGRLFLSTDGSSLVFSSDLPMIAEDTNSAVDVYRLDLRTDRLSMVSSKSGGTQSPTGGYLPSVSADGTKVAFTSAFPLDPLEMKPANGEDTERIYVHDLTARTVRSVSRDAFGRSVAPRDYLGAQISADGGHLAFEAYDGTLLVVPTAGGPAVDVLSRVGEKLDEVCSIGEFTAPSNGGKRIAFGVDPLDGDDQNNPCVSLQVADLRAGRVLQRLEETEEYRSYRSLRLTSDGATVLYGRTRQDKPSPAYLLTVGKTPQKLTGALRRVKRGRIPTAVPLALFDGGRRILVLAGSYRSYPYDSEAQLYVLRLR